MITENEDGTQTITAPPTQSHCQHDFHFYLDPDYESLLAQQTYEIYLREVAAGLITP